jgi:serine-type D-Ala-D-Ala carboxypeptidase
MEPLIKILDESVPKITPAAQIAMRQHGELVLSRAFGWLDPETRAHRADEKTLFDLASVTKLFTATAFMTLVEAGKAALDQPVSEVLPELHGLRPIQGLGPSPDALGERADAGGITFRALLVHNAGLPPWLTIDTSPGTARVNSESSRAMALNTPFAYRPGARVVYSDIGLILLGLAVETLTGLPLSQAIHSRVCAPLNLRQTRFLPLPPDIVPWYAFSPAEASGNIAPTEYCAWRGRRICGEVHDENAWRLGGVAGHAGLFSTARDVAALGQMYLDQGRPLLKPASVAEMVRTQAVDDDGDPRGIGFQLWSPSPEASIQPFGPRSFGHTGFTGTSLFVDPKRALVVALLTNEIYHGRANRQIRALRLAVHQALIEAVGYNGARQTLE